MDNPVIAIVGRPNVGKSTLFNRLTGSRSAIEDYQAGVTRDRLYGITSWRGKEITVIDTGGITFSDEIPLHKQVQRQVEIAIDEAAVIIFLMDAIEGITYLDKEIADFLRKTRKKTLLVANKMDHGKKDWEWFPFYELGLGEPFPVSATHGLGTGDLLDRIIEELPAEKTVKAPKDNVIKVAVVGRPNVGKSSMINKLTGEKERVIVNELPGTTRDAIDINFNYEGSDFVLVDTAGVRRRVKVKEDVEYYSVVRSIKAARRADVVLVVLDVSEGFTEQDQRIAGIAHEAGKGIIFIINKWDLIESAEDSAVKFHDKIRESFPFASYAPVLITSALTGRGIIKILDMVKKVYQECTKRLSTAILNELLRDAVLVNPPPSRKGVKAKFFYMTQPEIKPPTFVFFVNDAKLVHFSYLRYLENRLREAFGFEGVTLRIKLRQKKEPK